MRRLEGAVLACVLWILRVWPRFLVRPLAFMLGPWVARLARKEAGIFDRNVQEIFGLPPHSDFAAMFKKQCARHQIACMLETLQGIHNPAKLKVDGFDDVEREVRAAESAGKGHIIVTAHLGSWELVAYFGAKAASRPFRVLAKPARRQSITNALNSLREKMNVEVLWTDRKTLVRDMLKTLRAQESVGFVMDQKPEGRHGPVVDFFGRPTEFVSGPAAMSLKTDAPIIAVFCVRVGPYHFRLLTKTIRAANDATAWDETTLTAAMAQEIERVIRLYPEQWTWNYKRWRG